jgi:hypothetical protein
MQRLLEQTLQKAEAHRTKNRHRPPASLTIVNNNDVKGLPPKEVIDNTFHLFCEDTTTTTVTGSGSGGVGHHNDHDEEDDDHEPNEPEQESFNLTGLNDFRLQAILHELDYFDDCIQKGQGNSIREMSFSVRFQRDEEEEEEEEESIIHTKDDDEAAEEEEEKDAAHKDEEPQANAADPTVRVTTTTTGRQRFARFGQILATLPHLKELVLLLGHAVGSYDLLLPLLQAMAQSKSLSALHIFAGSSIGMTDQQLQDVSTALQTLQDLKEVYIGGIRSNLMASTLMTLPNLTTLELETKDEISPVESLPTFQPILEALVPKANNDNGTTSSSCSCPTLEELSLSGFHWDEIFSPTLRHALENPFSNLKHLSLTPRTLTVEHWRTAMSFLLNNTTLESLHVLTILPGRALVETIQQVASNPDSAVVELKFHCPASVMTTEEYIQAVTLLSTNTTLELLTTTVEQGSMRGTIDLVFDDEAYARLVQAARRNYGIISYDDVQRRPGVASKKANAKELNHHCYPSQDEEDDREDDTHELQVIGNLNRAGRRYVKEANEDSVTSRTNRYHGVDVLSDSHICNDLDAIYFHLLENPGLCCRDKDDDGGGKEERIGQAAVSRDESRVNTSTTTTTIATTAAMTTSFMIEKGTNAVAIPSISPGGTSSPTVPSPTRDDEEKSNKTNGVQGQEPPNKMQRLD